MAKRGVLEACVHFLDGSTFLTRNADSAASWIPTVFFHLIEGWSGASVPFLLCYPDDHWLWRRDWDRHRQGRGLRLHLARPFHRGNRARPPGRQRHEAAGVGSQRASVARETRLLAAVVLGGAGFVHVSEGWSPLDSLYWAIVTGSSVGYGDLVPIQPTTQIFTNVYLLVGVGAFAASIGRYAAAMAEEEEQRQLQAFVARGVSQESSMPSTPTATAPSSDRSSSSTACSPWARLSFKKPYT